MKNHFATRPSVRNNAPACPRTEGAGTPTPRGEEPRAHSLAPPRGGGEACGCQRRAGSCFQGPASPQKSWGLGLPSFSESPHHNKVTTVCLLQRPEEHPGAQQPPAWRSERVDTLPGTPAGSTPGAREALAEGTA